MALLLQVQEFEDKDTALLIDRYKYLDLYPCTTSELKAVGYFVSLPFTYHLHFFIKQASVISGNNHSLLRTVVTNMRISETVSFEKYMYISGNFIEKILLGSGGGGE